MYLWGGLYVDLDYVCLNPMDDLISCITRMGIPELPTNTYYKYHNGLLISLPGNSFWLKCAENAVNHFKLTQDTRVEHIAGPFRIQETIKTERPFFDALRPELVTPFDWFSFVPWGNPDESIIQLSRRIRNSSINDMRLVFPNAYALTFWDHQW